MQAFYEQSDSAHTYVSHYWHMQETVNGVFPQYTTSQWGFVFAEHKGALRAAIAGPRTLPNNVPFRSGEYFWGVTLHGEVGLGGMSKSELCNKNIPLILHGQKLIVDDHEFTVPTYNQLDDFIDSLITYGILHSTPIAAVSHRDTQRKVKRYIGLSPKQLEQSKRVDHAISLLNDTRALSDVAHIAGFSDQAHMNRDFKRLVGHTPAEIRRIFG